LFIISAASFRRFSWLGESAIIAASRRVAAVNDETPDSPPNRTELQIGVPTITRESIQGLPAIPGYQVLRELGRGGMGVVYEARHLSLDRTVAIKLMKRDDGLHQARFLAEGQIIAAVKHPNVVEVHDFGECSIGPFIAMEFLTGGSFSQKLKGGTALPPREAAEMIAKIAAGVGAAHDIGIVHRDLKPGNVLLDSNGNPKVTDFGLAKRTDFDLTLTHEAAGTPSYMAPEQARAMKFVGPPADVWSLGVMLYESLTGRKPFVAESDAELLITIQNAEPPTLRTLSKTIPHDLETICLKCLEKEPDRRYKSAKELATDLAVWLEGKPISARRATPAERAMLWVRRKPADAAAWTLGVLLLLSSALAILAANLWWISDDKNAIAESLKTQAERERQSAEEARNRAEAAENRAIIAKAEIAEQKAFVEYSRIIASVDRALGDYNFKKANIQLDICSQGIRGWEWKMSHRMCHEDYMTLSGHKKGCYIYSICYSPDGQLLLSAASDRMAILWDAETGEQLRKYSGHNEQVVRAIFSNDGSHVATCDREGILRVWDTNSAKLLNTITDKSTRIHNCIFNADGKKIICISDMAITGSKVTDDQKVQTSIDIWDWVTKTKERSLLGHSDIITSMTCAKDGSKLITASMDKTVKIWDMARYGDPKTIEIGFGIRSLWVNADATRVLAGSHGAQGICEYDAISGKQVRNIRAEGTVEFSKSGEMFVTAQNLRPQKGDDIRVYKTKTGALVRRLIGHEDMTYAASFSPDGNRIATGSNDGTIKIWRLREDDRAIQYPLTSGAETTLLSLDGNGQHAIVAKPRLTSDQRERLELRHMNSMNRAIELSVGSGPLVTDSSFRASSTGLGPYRFAFSNDGRRVAAVVEEGGSSRVRVWNASTGEVALDITRQSQEIRLIAYSPNSRYIFAVMGIDLNVLRTITASKMNAEQYVAKLRQAQGNCAGVVKIWDAATGRELSSISIAGGIINSASWSNDGTRIITCGPGSTVRVWDTLGGIQLSTIGHHTDDVICARYSPDDEQVITCQVPNIVQIWNAKANTLLLRLYSDDTRVLCADFSPDGSRIITSCLSLTKGIRIWDSKFGFELSSYGFATNSGTYFAHFTPNGENVLFYSVNGRFGVLNTAPIRRELIE
jgi:WD40 repeat protein